MHYCWLVCFEILHFQCSRMQYMPTKIISYLVPTHTLLKPHLLEEYQLLKSTVA